MNGIGAKDFAWDMAMSFRELLTLEEEPLEALAGHAALETEAIKTLASWTGRPIGDVRMEFRAEVFVSRGLRNPTMRGCPVCLREDAEAYDGPPLEAMVMRGDWQFREVTLCIRHHQPLVPLWTAAHPSDRFDIGARLNEIIPDIMAGKLEQRQQRPDAYDIWLDDRLESGRDATWFAQHELYPAATFCRLLGRELLRLDPPVDVDENSLEMQARARGFAVASQGEASILAALKELKQSATGRNQEIRAALGELFYRKTSNASLDLECFAPFRDILRSFVVGSWPIEKGAIVYGAPLPERIIHSVRTASLETGIGQELLGQLLAEVGAIDAKDNRPDAHKTFPASKYAPFLADVPTWVGPLKMRQAMGATRAEFSNLVQDQVLPPRTRLPKVNKAWCLSDGLKLVEELKAKAALIRHGDESWEKLQSAKARSGISVGALIEAIRSGSLQVGVRCNEVGYQAISVPKNEVDKMLRDARVHDTPDHLSASLFGRTVGLRDKGRFLSLVQNGHTPATRLRNPNTNMWRYVMTEADTVAFHNRFTTLATMAQEFGGHRHTYLAALRAANVAPFAPDGNDYGHLYLRKDVEPVLRQKKLID